MGNILNAVFMIPIFLAYLVGSAARPFGGNYILGVTRLYHIPCLIGTTVLLYVRRLCHFFPSL